jgi:CDP-glucose 4,6-dehydratase
MEAARNSELVERVVFASSDKAYGDHERLPYSEDTPLQGRHPYDVSKSCADLIAQSYFHTYGLPVCVARCGNLYGPGDLNFNRIIPGTIRSILLGQKPQIRSDGTYTRDYLFVKDAAQAYMVLAENMHRKEIVGQSFNFSTMNKITVLQLVKLILKEMGSKLESEVLNQAKGEIRHQYLSSEKAKKLLKWEAAYSIEKGLKETIPWYVDYIKKRAV